MQAMTRAQPPLDLENAIGMFGEETCNTGGSRLVSLRNEVELVMVDS